MRPFLQEVSPTLIRNAVIDGYPGPVDLRLMHGTVQEIGVGLQKGLYESELDLAGDALRPCPPEMPLPQRYRIHAEAGESAHIVPGAREPFLRYHEGVLVGLIDSHTAD